ncbi:MAG: hypothetical protein LBD67_08460 [Candidatus Accumulibacter sp.]|nr:hypothetical protein [Accumulibacter sp.]
MNGRSVFPVLTLRQASFDRLRTGQGERTERRSSTGPGRDRANGLKNMPSTSSG